MPDVSPTIDAAASAEQERTTRGRHSGGSHPSSGMSQDGNDLLALQNHTTEAMQRMYQRPEEAYRRLTELDDAGVVRFKQNPSEIGPLRDGVELTPDQIGGLAAAREADHLAPKSAHDEVDRHNERNESHSQEQLARNAPERQGLEAKINDTLAGASTASHHLSI